jgi:hypothetical protein
VSSDMRWQSLAASTLSSVLQRRLRLLAWITMIYTAPTIAHFRCSFSALTTAKIDILALRVHQTGRNSIASSERRFLQDVFLDLMHLKPSVWFHSQVHGGGRSTFSAATHASLQTPLMTLYLYQIVLLSISA